MSDARQRQRWTNEREALRRDREEAEGRANQLSQALSDATDTLSDLDCAINALSRLLGEEAPDTQEGDIGLPTFVRPPMPEVDEILAEQARKTAPLDE